VLTTHSSDLAQALLGQDGAVGFELRLQGGSTSVAPM